MCGLLEPLNPFSTDLFVCPYISMWLKQLDSQLSPDCEMF